MCDRFVFLRLMLKEVAKRFGAFATFMPKPSASDFRSGSHYNMSLVGPDGGNADGRPGRSRGRRLLRHRVRLRGGSTRALRRADGGLLPDRELLQGLRDRRHRPDGDGARHVVGADPRRLRRQQPRGDAAAPQRASVRGEPHAGHEPQPVLGRGAVARRGAGGRASAASIPARRPTATCTSPMARRSTGRSRRRCSRRSSRSSTTRWRRRCSAARRKRSSRPSSGASGTSTTRSSPSGSATATCDSSDLMSGPLADMEDEARRVLAGAEDRGVTLRLMGGLAVRLHSGVRGRRRSSASSRTSTSRPAPPRHGRRTRCSSRWATSRAGSSTP